ncbi:trypsin-like peptidase domain-containing protein [Streptomyces sp. NPDC048717]|uniref:S1C family serine protease n=1 Tax=Streptomyces sp. NPDC048717 TaxID=3154928 RepID=UPI003448A1E5
MTDFPEHQPQQPQPQPSWQSWPPRTGRTGPEEQPGTSATAAMPPVPPTPPMPPMPPYDPARPFHTGAPGAYEQPAPHGRTRRTRRRGAGLLTAVAIAAAAIGGGTATLVERWTNDSPGITAAPSPVDGTTVAAGSKGTVAGVAQAVSPSIVEISATGSGGKATGSGVIITSGGEIVTNNHVISGASTLTVRLSTGKTYAAEVVGTDPAKDLALIKLRGASGLKAATLGDSAGLRVGDQVVAIGSPEGLTGTVTSGIVSALDRDVTVAREDGGQNGQSGQSDQGRQWDPRQGWPFEFGGQRFNGDTGSSKTTYKAIQTDASLNPGNSGGALIDMNGRIIGINAAMYAPGSGGDSGTAGSVGLGFAIPVDTLKADLPALRAGGGS